MGSRGKKSARLPVFIFDFGGVVIKWKNNNPIFDYVAKRYGVPREEMRVALESSLLRLESGKLSMDEYLAHALAKFGKHLKEGDSPDELWTRPFERLVKFSAGTVRLVETLRNTGFLVYLFSNTSPPHASLVRRKKWDRLFDGFLCSCELGSVKPEALAFRRALERSARFPQRSSSSMTRRRTSMGRGASASGGPSGSRPWRR